MTPYYQELTRTSGRPSKRMMPVGFRIIIKEPFYVSSEARRYMVTPKQAGVHPKAVTNGNERPPGVGDSRDCTTNQPPELRRNPQSLDTERVGSYGWAGGFLVIAELWKHVFSLRYALEFPPCNESTDLDELLSSTMEALQSLSPGKLPTTFSFESSEGDQKSIFQRLQRFYKTLRVIEDTWVDSFAHKASTFVEENGANDAGFDGWEHCSVSSASTCALKRTDSNNDRSQGHNQKQSEDASNLEQLSQMIFEKLDDISRRARHILEMEEDDEGQREAAYEISDSSESSQPLGSEVSWYDLNLESKVYSEDPLNPTSGHFSVR